VADFFFGAAIPAVEKATTAAKASAIDFMRICPIGKPDISPGK
jgi:hypothetical protein